MRHFLLILAAVAGLSIICTQTALAADEKVSGPDDPRFPSKANMPAK